jgi:sugar lactone lactonase YvrE
MFGIDAAPGGQLLVADAGRGVVDADTGALVASLPGVTDIAPIGRGDMLALTSTFAPGTHGALYRVSRGSTRKLADLQEYELQNDPAGDGTAEGSDPYDLARLAGGKTLIADAAGNDLLVADEAGNIDWVATFPEQNGAQAVPTSVVIGPDGAYYVGELTGFPATPGLSRVWRVAPGTRHAHCGTSSACSVVVTGLTSIIDLAVGPDGKLYVAQLDDASWRAVEGGGGVGGSVHACDLVTGSCQTVVSHVPILTSIAFRGSTLWGAIWALVPGQADVIPLTP